QSDILNNDRIRLVEIDTCKGRTDVEHRTPGNEAWGGVGPGGIARCPRDPERVVRNPFERGRSGGTTHGRVEPWAFVATVGPGDADRGQRAQEVDRKACRL